MDLNKRIFTALLPLAAIALAGCGGSKGGAFANVNGDSIGKDEFFKAMELKTSATVTVDPQGLRSNGNQVPIQAYAGTISDGNIGFETLKELVNQKLILQLAAEQNVSPTTAEVEQEIENQKKDDPDFLKKLTARGFSLDFIRTTILGGLAQEKVITKGIKISDKQVDDYIAAHPDSFVNPERVKLLYIVAKDKKDRDTIDSELASGKQFVVVASQYSADHAAAPGYQLLANGSDAVPAYEPKIQEIIKSTGEGKQSIWYPQGPGFVKFMVVQKTPSTKIPIDANIKRKVGRRLALDDGNKAIDFTKEVTNKLKTAKVEVQDEAMKGLWEQYMKQLKSEPTMPAAPAGGAAATPAAPSASPTAK
jgi:foldase protein PrsA